MAHRSKVRKSRRSRVKQSRRSRVKHSRRSRVKQSRRSRVKHSRRSRVKHSRRRMYRMHGGTKPWDEAQDKFLYRMKSNDILRNITKGKLYNPKHINPNEVLAVSEGAPSTIFHDKYRRPEQSFSFSKAPREFVIPTQNN